jgi:phosphoserine phosphatase
MKKQRFKRTRIISGVVKDITTKEAKLRARGIFRKVTKKHPKIKAIIVDVDGTLLKTNIYSIIAQNHPKLKKFQEKMLINLRKGKIGFDEAFKQMSSKYNEFNINKSEMDAALSEILKNKTKVNVPLISALRALQKEGIKIIVATRTSGYVAEQLRKRYGFDYSIGSKEKIDRNGYFSGMEYLIGMSNKKLNGINVYTKSKLISKKWGIKEKNLAMITDEFSDIVSDKSGHNILFKAKKPIEPEMTKLAQRLRMYDKRIDEGEKNFREKIIAYMSNPKTQDRKKLLKQELKKIPGMKMRVMKKKDEINL